MLLELAQGACRMWLEFSELQGLLHQLCAGTSAQACSIQSVLAQREQLQALAAEIPRRVWQVYYRLVFEGVASAVCGRYMSGVE